MRERGRNSTWLRERENVCDRDRGRKSMNMWVRDRENMCVREIEGERVRG